jgi:hypothetical protein
VTQFATAAAGFTWMLVEWMLRGKPTVVGICTGAVAGLVAITPASGFVGPLGSLVIGAAAGVVCYWGCSGLKHMFGYDDALDAFGVHAVGGAAGAILTGVFAIEQYGGTPGLLEGNAGQVINQCIERRSSNTDTVRGDYPAIAPSVAEALAQARASCLCAERTGSVAGQSSHRPAACSSQRRRPHGVALMLPSACSQSRSCRGSCSGVALRSERRNRFAD